MEDCRRLLECLNCPYAKTVNFSSRGDVILLVTWLEDRKIRELEIEQREKLRKDHIGWDASFDQYLKQLGCPYTWSSINNCTAYIDCIAWLISHSISTEYEDLSDECINLENSNVGDDMEVEIDFSASNSQLKVEVDNLGKMVSLERRSEETDPEFLQRISRQVRLFLTEGSMKAIATEGKEGIPLEDFPLGFNTQDEVVNQVALVLRMLYISDFRELQNDLNALIVLGQEYTANPKTNSTLGKVGR